MCYGYCPRDYDNFDTLRQEKHQAIAGHQCPSVEKDLLNNIYGLKCFAASGDCR